MTLRYNRHDQRANRQTLRRTSTPAEQKLWRHLRADQLGTKFRRQFSVDAYVLDFYAPQWKLAVEVDGGSHFSDAGEAHDRERTEHLARFGIKVLRFTNTDVMSNLDGVLRVIEQAAPGKRQTSP